MSWKLDGACVGADPDLWFRETAIAREICATCPVRARCEAEGAGEEFGTWGGVTERERAAGLTWDAMQAGATRAKAAAAARAVKVTDCRGGCGRLVARTNLTPPEGTHVHAGHGCCHTCYARRYRGGSTERVRTPRRETADIVRDLALAGTGLHDAAVHVGRTRARLADLLRSVGEHDLLTTLRDNERTTAP